MKKGQRVKCNGIPMWEGKLGTIVEVDGAYCTVRWESSYEGPKSSNCTRKRKSAYGELPGPVTCLHESHLGVAHDN